MFVMSSKTTSSRRGLDKGINQLATELISSRGPRKLDCTKPQACRPSMVAMVDMRMQACS